MTLLFCLAISCANSHLVAKEEGQFPIIFFSYSYFSGYLFHWKIIWIICTLFINLPYSRSKLPLLSASFLYTPSIILHRYLQIFETYSCKCQQCSEVYFIILMKILKKKISPRPHIPHIPKHLPIVKCILSLQLCIEVPSIHWGFQHNANHV